MQCAVPNFQMNFWNVRNCCCQSIRHHRPVAPIKMNTNGSTKDTTVCIPDSIPFPCWAHLCDSQKITVSLSVLLGWWQYDERTCQEIEEAYKNAEKQCTILVAGNLYIVDFDQMLQKRHTDPARKRQVKRKIAILRLQHFFHSL